MSYLEIVIATQNPKKFRELNALLRLPGVRLRSLDAFDRVPAIRETGKTFDENAVHKALSVAKATGRLVIADDSGLEVEALGGLPGVRSARFAGRHGKDHANTAKLLRLLQGRSPSARRARFRCTLVLASPERLLHLTRGTLSGRIAVRPKGRGGFGYDPVFLVPRLQKTVAQLPAAVKNRISHRAQAARTMRRLLARALKGSRA